MSHRLYFLGAVGLLIIGLFAFSTVVAADDGTPKILSQLTFHFSRHGGGQYPNYNYPNCVTNMRVMFGYVAPGERKWELVDRNPANGEMNLDRFTGSYAFGGNTPIWLNGVFGPFGAEWRLNSEFGSVPKSGCVCNSISMVAQALAEAGCTVDQYTNHSAPGVPEVNPLYSIGVVTYSDTVNPYVKNGQDIRVTCSKTTTLLWNIDKDLINLTAYEGIVTVNNQPPESSSLPQPENQEAPAAQVPQFEVARVITTVPDELEFLAHQQPTTPPMPTYTPQSPMPTQQVIVSKPKLSNKTTTVVVGLFGLSGSLLLFGMGINRMRIKE